MALFGQQTRKDDGFPRSEDRAEPQVVEVAPYLAPVPHTPTRSMEETRPTMTPTLKTAESILAAGLTIEGKIEGTGNVRVAGRFHGNVNVKGELTIEPGAAIDGEVTADSVLVGGEVRGHIVSTSRVEFKESGVLIGDLKAGSLTVAAGSKMRGKVEFGWKDGEIEAAGISDHQR
jgi:cytoskeletal protein CcmA (bactofilin family)